MKVLVACEFSGIVREEFSKMGHDATSCDFLDSEIPGKHYKGDVRDLLNDGWDEMIAHPPCRHLAVSGAAWFKRKQKKQEGALDFVKELMDCPIPRIAIENPISIISTRVRKPDQIIQPWQFGHGASKATCFWLKNLPKLVPTNVVDGRDPVRDTRPRIVNPVENKVQDVPRRGKSHGRTVGENDSIAAAVDLLCMMPPMADAKPDCDRPLLRMRRHGAGVGDGRLRHTVCQRYQQGSH